MAAPKKIAATEEVEKKEEVQVPKEKKYRCDFKTWKEYAAYKGPKG